MICAVACKETPEQEIVPPTSEGRVTLTVSSESSLLSMEEGGAAGKVLFRSRGGELFVDVVTNQDEWRWEAENAEWLTIEADKYGLRLMADANTSEASRTASIFVATNKGPENCIVELSVEQNHAGVPEIELAQQNLNFKAHTGLQQRVAVNTNQDEWDFDCTCPWLLIEKGEGELILTADDNLTTAQRTATIELTTGIGDSSATDRLTVSQDGSAFIKLASHNIATDDEGGEKRVEIISNPELDWDFEVHCSEWVEAEREEDVLLVRVAPNEGGLERFGTLTITVGDEDNSASVTMKVHQIGSDTDELIYEVEITEPNFTLTAAPVLTLSSGGAITVDWGDGSEIETFESKRGTHTYAQAGMYTISITGEAHQLEFSDGKTTAPEVKNIISWGKLGVKNAADMCLGCVNLESIPNDVAGSFENVKSFIGAFSLCTSLKEIPSGLFRYATLAKNFEDCFSYAESVTEIPEDLFANCTAAERFTYAFYGVGTGYVDTTYTLPNFNTEVKPLVQQGRLTAIPEGLFRNCASALRFDYVFGATAIESIPEGLFANNSAATIFTGAFSACVNLKSIPQGLMKGATAATDIKYMFAGCESVTEIPTGMFVNNSAVTNLEYIFYKTGVKKLSKGLFEGLAAARTIGAVFQDCLSLSEIEEGVFDGLTAATSFKYCFSGCSSLQSIPEGLFRGLEKAYEFKSTFENTALDSVPAGLFADARDYSLAELSYAFAGCANLKTVPATLFEKFTTAGSYLFQCTFYKSGIETIPAGLFAKNVKVSTGFESTFEGCTKLTTIEGPIFPESTTVSALEYTFAGCTALETLPEGFFDSLAGSQTKFTATFAECTALKTLPEGLFAKNTLAKSFTNTFNGCKSLTTLPENLMGSKEKVTSVKGMFQNCSALTAIPADIFAEAPAITSFENTFAGCEALESLPEELFAAIGTKTSGITFSECFMDCKGLNALPAGLFDTVRRISYIDGCFKNCSALTGESPYTIIAAEDGTEQKVHLYERTRGTDFPTVSSSTSAHQECFMGCSGLSDYEAMPTSWK